MHNHQYFILALIAAALTLSSCAAQKALQDMKQTKAAYQACLEQHQKDADTACKRQKEVYEAAGQNYDGMNKTPDKRAY